MKKLKIFPKTFLYSLAIMLLIVGVAHLILYLLLPQMVIDFVPSETKEASMVQSVTYQSETKTVHFQGKSIVLESLTPVLSPKEKEKRKKEIERCLYEVFSKYRRASDTPA